MREMCEKLILGYQSGDCDHLPASRALQNLIGVIHVWNAIGRCLQCLYPDDELGCGIALEQPNLSRIQRPPDVVVFLGVPIPFLRNRVVGRGARIVATQLDGILRGRIRWLGHTDHDTPREKSAR